MSILVTRTIRATSQQVATQTGVTPGKWRFRMTPLANRNAGVEKLSDVPEATFLNLVLNTQYTVAIARVDTAGALVGVELVQDVQITQLPSDPVADVPAAFTLS